jgi:hypothetical protein
MGARWCHAEILREGALQHREHEYHGEKERRSIEQRMNIAGLVARELYEYIRNKAKADPVGDIEGKRQGQNGEEGGNRFVRGFLGDKTYCRHHQEANDHERGRGYGETKISCPASVPGIGSEPPMTSIKGENGSASRKSSPTTMLVSPVRPPAATPEPLSM